MITISPVPIWRNMGVSPLWVVPDGAGSVFIDVDFTGPERDFRPPGPHPKLFGVFG